MRLRVLFGQSVHRRGGQSAQSMAVRVTLAWQPGQSASISARSERPAPGGAQRVSACHAPGCDILGSAARRGRAPLPASRGSNARPASVVCSKPRTGSAANVEGSTSLPCSFHLDCLEVAVHRRAINAELARVSPSFAGRHSLAQIFGALTRRSPAGLQCCNSFPTHAIVCSVDRNGLECDAIRG